MSKTKEILILVLGAVVILAIPIIISIGIISANKEIDKVEEAILEETLEDFYSIRDEDEPYTYTYKEWYVGNVEKVKGETHRVFKVIIYDMRGNNEIYSVEIIYKKRLFNIDIKYIKARSWDYE